MRDNKNISVVLTGVDVALTQDKLTNDQFETGLPRETIRLTNKRQALTTVLV